MRRNMRGHTRKSVAGFSLIEILVSILIISLGILGTSSLLIKGMNNAKTASLRSTAAAQASSLAAAIYANRTFWAVRTSDINFTSSGAEISNKSTNIDTTQLSCNACSPAQIAGLDVSTWVASLDTALPDAKSDVSCPKVDGNAAHNCTIKISWSERFIEQGKTTVAASAATSGERHYFLYVEP